MPPYVYAADGEGPDDISLEHVLEQIRIGEEQLPRPKGVRRLPVSMVVGQYFWIGNAQNDPLYPQLANYLKV